MLIMVPYKHVGNIAATELLNSGKLKLPHLVYLKYNIYTGNDTTNTCKGK